MRTISLWQPFASAIALGLKRIETRSWSTGYRGPLAIHASKTREDADVIFMQAVAPSFAQAGITKIDDLPFGCVVAVCTLLHCRRVEEVRDRISPLERALGGYSDGRWAWELGDVKALAVPLSWRGSQGFFEVPTSQLDIAT